jgi:hypothetical protein
MNGMQTGGTQAGASGLASQSRYLPQTYGGTQSGVSSLSGLARFGQAGGYRLAAYTPRTYSPAMSLSSMYGQPAQGLQSGAQPISAPYGTQERGDSMGTMGQGGTSGATNGQGSPISLNTAGILGRGAGALLGGAVAGPIGAMYGGKKGDEWAVSLASDANGPGDPSHTDPSSVDAVNGMDAMSDAYSGGVGGFGGGSGGGNK